MQEVYGKDSILRRHVNSLSNFPSSTPEAEAYTSSPEICLETHVLDRLGYRATFQKCLDI